ncbi:hypothetical protein HBE96_13505 [Clostridium sp. P21]|uniref:GOLD domain-containing protein n=2 Tax=Clostridium muellerianum TaxID=2716538 RepID=A0A7Y0EJN6_9CLOT|nr:hypothetical protein [Clostridium muellerianum]
MEGGKEQELQELSEEIEIILSIKDDISKEEICNFKSKFSLLSEYDIRKKISEITKNNIYLEEFEEVDIDEKIEDDNEIKDIHNDTDVINKQENSITNLVVTNEINENENGNESFKENESNENGNENESFKESEISKENENPKETVEQEETIDENSKQNIKIVYEDNKKSVEIVNEEDIPEVSFVKADIKYGQLSLEWGWNEKIDKVLICYRMDKFPTSPKDSAAFQVVVTKEDCREKGNYIINKVNEGNYYFSIYVMMECNGKTLFSKAQRRLVTNKEPVEIFYEIKIKKSLFGKVKSAEVILSTNEKEINLPQLVLIGKFGNIPIQKSDGEAVLNIDYDSITGEDLLSFDIPIENLSKNMYVKLFFVDDSNSKLYRIISPSKENLHFK